MTHYESSLSTRYASKEMQALFSPHFKYRTWRRLWIALAESEKELGLPISDKQIAEMKAHADAIDFEKVRLYEKETRHEVMAHIHAYGEVCPSAKGIIHLGATSSYVMDNGDLIQLLSGLNLIKERLIFLIEKLNHLALKNAETPCLAYTHFQPAQATTFGKRVSLYLQDLLTDFKDLLYILEDFPFLGAKGAIGTQTSFLTLFGGDEKKVLALDNKITEKMGFTKSYSISSQTFPRKQELRILSLLAGIASSAHKCATDLRLLAHLGEIEEPFGQEQVGSSAMPHKRNPILCERVCGLSRFITNLWHNASDNASQQWLERSLDDSSNRRLTLPEAFLSTDAVLVLLYTILDSMNLYPKVMETHLQEHLPYISIEVILAKAVLKGKDRQQAHKRLKQLSYETLEAQRNTENPSDLLSTMLQEMEISPEEVAEDLKLKNLTGRAKQQVIEFLKLEVEPLLERHLLKGKPMPKLEV